MCTWIDLLRSCEKVEKSPAGETGLAAQPIREHLSVVAYSVWTEREGDGAPGRSFRYRQAVGIDVGYVTVVSFWGSSSSSC